MHIKQEIQRHSYEIWAIAHRILTEMVRTRRSLMFWLIFPTLMLLLFGSIYAGRTNSAESFDRTSPGVLIGAAGTFYTRIKLPFFLQGISFSFALSIFIN